MSYKTFVPVKSHEPAIKCPGRGRERPDEITSTRPDGSAIRPCTCICVTSSDQLFVRVRDIIRTTRETTARRGSPPSKVSPGALPILSPPASRSPSLATPTHPPTVPTRTPPHRRERATAARKHGAPAVPVPVPVPVPRRPVPVPVPVPGRPVPVPARPSLARATNAARRRSPSSVGDGARARGGGDVRGWFRLREERDGNKGEDDEREGSAPGDAATLPEREAPGHGEIDASVSKSRDGVQRLVDVRARVDAVEGSHGRAWEHCVGPRGGRGRPARVALVAV